MNFKKGDKAVIIAKKHGHYFDMKEKITISKVNKYSGDYLATNGKESWYIKDDEINATKS